MAALFSRKALLLLLASVTVATTAALALNVRPGFVQRTIPQRVPSLTVVERSTVLGVTPDEARIPVGGTVGVEVYIDSQIIPVNAAQGTLAYPSSRLELQEISTAGSVFTLWPVEPAASGPGAILFAGGLPSPGFLGNFGKLFSVRFRVLAPGVSAVEIADALLLANDGFGTNVLNEVRPARLIGVQATERLGDINADGQVNASDLGILISNWGAQPLNPRADINGDGKVDMLDMSVLFSEWGS